MFDLKPISSDSLGSAQKKAVRYRLLNEPRLAESICRDILAVEPDNQDALITLILSLSDQYGPGSTVAEAMEMVPKLETEFQRQYYAGIVAERRALAILRAGTPGAGHTSYDWLRRAMDYFDAAEEVAPEGNDDGVLRWNTCARVINSRADVRPIEETEPDLHILE
jgi:hypothetical protein